MLLSIILSASTFAQVYSKGISRTMSVKEISKSAFHFLEVGNKFRNNIDPNTAFIQLHEIIRDDGTVFHLLIQEDLDGRPMLLGVDIELMKVFHCENNKPYSFGDCILKKDTDPWIMQKTAAYLDCILERLNRCR